MAKKSPIFLTCAAMLGATVACANIAEAKSKHQAAYKDPNAPVISIIKRIEAASKSGGEGVFSHTFDEIDKRVGEQIQVDMLLVEEDAKDENGPYYTYQNGELIFTFEPSTKHYIKASEGEFLAYWLDGEKRPNGSYIGTNAFGVKRKINRTIFKSYELAIMNKEEIKYKYKILLSRDEAEKYDYRAAFVIKGTITKFSNGHVGSCEPEISAPTLDDPRDLVGKRCYLAFAATEVDLLYDGKVVASQTVEK